MNNPLATIKVKGLEPMVFQLYLDTYDSTGNFVELARDKYYDGLEFFNHQEDFIQTGCKNNNGTSHLDYTIRGEFATNGFINKHKHHFGSLGFVRSLNRDSASAQIYISFAENYFFDDNFSVFGDIVLGREQLERLHLEKRRWTIESIRIDDRGEELPKVVKIKI